MATTRKNPSSASPRYCLGREVQLMVNVMIDATHTRALTGEGNLDEQAMRYLRVLIEGLRTEPKKINRQPNRG